MPRGNDSAAALVDLRGQYGQYGGNAEDLIAVGRASVSPQLRAANMQKVNQKATIDLLGQDGLDKADDLLDDDKATALDLSVRGQFVVALFETDETGRTFKEAWPLADFGLDSKERSAHAAKFAEQEDANTTEERNAALGRMAQAVEVANAAKEAEEKVEVARAKAQQSRANKTTAEKTSPESK